MDIQQFKIKYIADAVDLLNKLDDDLILFEKNPNDEQIIEQIFRVMHTLKGTSGMYGFEHISNLTHDLESIFNLVRDKSIEVSTELFNLTLASVDHIRNLLNDEDLADTENSSNHSKISAQISQLLTNTGHRKPEFVPKETKRYDEQIVRTWQILFMPNELLIKRSINILYTLEDLFKLGKYKLQEPDDDQNIAFWSIFLITDKPLNDIEDALIFVMDFCKIQLIAEFDIFSEEEFNSRTRQLEAVDDFMPSEPQIRENFKINVADIKTSKIEKHTTNRIHVDAAKLDTLMFLVSELVTTKSELVLAMAIKDEDRMSESVQKVDKLSKLFRDNALDIRLISMQELITKFNRLIRDLSGSLGKKIEFETIGTDVELDKTIIDSISEPIMHLIRNCIDHGIETPEDRAEANKPEVGMIKLFAYKSGNFVFIQISDDGKGIDKQKITKKAIEKGIITENAQLTDKEIYDLMFLPGFSTAESLTQVSGRGVGMDIVRKRIQEIRGEITIDSESGLGTSFTLKLQQTISIIDTLLLRTHNSKFAIPLEEVESCELIETAELDLKQNKQMIYKEGIIPFVSLKESFKYFYQINEIQRVIVVNKQGKRFAIIVDEIIGEYQAVVKPLGSAFSDVEFLSGASLLGDGSIALLLDTDKLKKQLIN